MGRQSGEEHKAELEVLETPGGGQLIDGTIEDDDGEDHKQKSSSTGDLIRCWVHIARCADNISGTVDGLTWVDGTRDWKVEGKLSKKVARWKEEDRIE